MPHEIIMFCASLMLVGGPLVGVNGYTLGVFNSEKYSVEYLKILAGNHTRSSDAKLDKTAASKAVCILNGYIKQDIDRLENEILRCDTYRFAKDLGKCMQISLLYKVILLL